MTVTVFTFALALAVELLDEAFGAGPEPPSPETVIVWTYGSDAVIVIVLIFAGGAAAGRAADEEPDVPVACELLVVTELCFERRVIVSTTVKLMVVTASPGTLLAFAMGLDTVATDFESDDALLCEQPDPRLQLDPGEAEVVWPFPEPWPELPPFPVADPEPVEDEDC